MFFCTFLRSGSKGVPGWCQGPSQGSPGSKKLQNGCPNDSKIINKYCPEAFWKRFSKTHALSMFLNSSGLFFNLFLLMQRRTLCHIHPSKVPTLIHLARGENLRWFPPSPGCVQDSLPSGSDPKKTFWCFCDLKTWFKKWSQRAAHGVPNWLKIDRKLIKCWL